MKDVFFSPPILDAQMRYKRSVSVDPENTWEMEIKSIECKTADYPNAGMGAGLFGIKALAGGEFYMKVCGPRDCCETGHLDNDDNNWRRNEVKILVVLSVGLKYRAGCRIIFTTNSTQINGKVIHSRFV